MSKYLTFPLGFDAQVNEPIDKRFVVETIASRDAIISEYRYEGLQTYCKEDQKVYILKGGIENSDWQELNDSKAVIESLQSSLDTKANQSSLESLTNTVNEKVNTSDLYIRTYRLENLGTTRLNGEFVKTLSLGQSLDFDYLELFIKVVHNNTYNNQPSYEVLRLTIMGKLNPNSSGFSSYSYDNDLETYQIHVGFHGVQLDQEYKSLGGRAEGLGIYKVQLGKSATYGLFLYFPMNGFVTSSSFEAQVIQYGGTTNAIDTSTRKLSNVYRTVYSTPYYERFGTF